ncbi:telomerase reverse transcriptase [Hevea brasiliensis]|uniref:telomerase reverse transcriptase n=1 Tax=Hevea brasiliensis TaxID=3981 RepID=UPI0025E59633|nr:telomerase reverse transcriptase [Hevea brasiliensis]
MIRVVACFSFCKRVSSTSSLRVLRFSLFGQQLLLALKRMRKKRRVPLVLWRLFRDRARTLATTITSLIPPHSPPPPPSCHCKGRLCLNCCGTSENVMSFLLQSRDPPDYRKLLNHCFIVVTDNAPPFAATEFRPCNNWPQHEIVIRTIEMIMREQPTSSNVICCAYDKCNHSSPIVELLTSSAWSLLLKRVGDGIMFYLLKHTSIFLPLPRKKHHQVAGPPVNNLVLKLTKRTTEPQCQDPSVIHFGHGKKRDGDDSAISTSDIQQHNPLCILGSINCVGCSGGNYIKRFSRNPASKYGQMSVSKAAATTVGADSTNYKVHSNELVNPRKRSRPLRWQRCKKQKHSDIDESTSIRPSNEHIANRCVQMGVAEAATPTTEPCTLKYEGFLNKRLQGLNQVIEKPKKRSRVFRWQRCKRHRHLDVEEPSDKTFHLNEDRTLRRLQYDLNNSKSDSHKKMSQQCSCFLVLQSAHLITKGALINRQPMFYNLKCSSSVLPKKHLLNSLKPNFAGSKSLVGSIFGLSDVNVNAPSVPCSLSSHFCLIGSSSLYHSLVKLLKILIRRTHCCKHLRLLDKHCVLSLTQITNLNSNSVFKDNDSKREVSEKFRGLNIEHCKRTPETNDPQTEAIKSYCSKSQVVSFIWAVCRNLVPPDLLGSPSNWRILRRNISKFIQLRRFEKFSLKQCMHKLKTSGFPFLSDKHSLCYLDAGVPNNVQGQNLEMHEEFCKLNNAASSLKHMLLQRWILWFFSCLVVPLVQANFYVTESEHGKQDIFYYRKSIWEKLKNRTIGCLKDQNYQCLDASDVKRIISKRLFGFSKLRLCPKENGARMLANLKAPSRMLVQESSSIGMPRKAQVCSKSVKYKHFKSVNCVLRDTHAVLKGIQLREPERLGSSVFDYNDIHKKLCLFIIGLKNELGTLPDLFIVVSDVSKAFDSIDQDKLLNVMKDVIHEDEYLLQQSSQVVCTKKSLWVHENLILADPDISTGFAKSYSARFGSLHTVLVNQGSSRYMKKRELFFNLNEHVKRNVLQLDKKFYLQGVGIPQGSILSSLLCSLYYGHLERNVIFPFLEKNYELATEDLSRRHKCQDASVAGNSSEDRISPSHCYMLLRLIDDFCFISTSKRLAAGFYTRLRRGFRDYNCYMNEEKFCLNFDARHASGLPSNRVYVGEDGISFIRWSGLLLNSCTLEVQADYTRYLNNHLRSTLTVSWQGKPGHHLKAKLCDFMRPKCHPIFFDSNINSEPVVRLNIYQSFLLCAMKFHCYVSEMLYICKLHPRYHLKTIERSLRYMYMLIKKRMLSANTGSHFHTVLQLAAEEVEWLGLNAFIKVLKRKQSQHKELLCMLKSKLLAHKINGTVSSQLSYAVDSSHSSVMWKIKY